MTQDQGVLEKSSEDPWPNVSLEQLQMLWKRYQPSFLRLENLEEELQMFKVTFLTYLEKRNLFPIETGSASLGRRPQLKRISLARTDPTIAAEVILSLNGASARIVRSAKLKDQSMVSLAAEATLLALSELLPQARFEVSAAYTTRPTRAGGDSSVLVEAKSTAGAPEEFLGACQARGFEAEAAARAALDATNRYVEALLSNSPVLPTRN